MLYGEPAVRTKLIASQELLTYSRLERKVTQSRVTECTHREVLGLSFILKVELSEIPKRLNMLAKGRGGPRRTWLHISPSSVPSAPKGFNFIYKAPQVNILPLSLFHSTS